MLNRFITNYPPLPFALSAQQQSL